MSSSSSTVPAGYRFYPTEQELLSFYLHHKLENTRRDIERVIPVVDVYAFDPHQLPPMSGEPCIRDTEQWFFFCPRQDREVHGGRPARTTPSGYWKATGSPNLVYSSNRAIGLKKTMVFYRGKAPLGNKTKWKMNEYKALEENATTTVGASLKLRNEFSLCRIYVKNGCLRSFDRRPLGPSNESGRMAEASSSTMPPSVTERPSSPGCSSSNGGAEVGFDMEMLENINLELLDWV